jgi:hypothetical protein
LTSTKERLEDIKQAIDMKATDTIKTATVDPTVQKTLLIELADSFINKTSVPEYSERIKLKSALKRRMGEIIVKNNFQREELLLNNKSEGMLLGISYSVQLQPNKEGLSVLNNISRLATQKYTRYSILVSYDTLVNNGLIEKAEVPQIREIIMSFRQDADQSLLKKIDDSLNLLKMIDPTTS